MLLKQEKRKRRKNNFADYNIIYNFVSMNINYTHIQFTFTQQPFGNLSWDSIN